VSKSDSYRFCETTSGTSTQRAARRVIVAVTREIQRELIAQQFLMFG
jgi:hypothetical protein